MANIPTTAWDETSPAGSQAVSLGDDRIREMKTQTREVIGVDHKMASSGNDADNGKHNKVSLLEQADLGTGVNGKPLLGAQTVSSKPELLFTNEDDVDIQITKNTKIFLDNGRLSNNVQLTARNAADGADVNIIKVNASDTVEIPNGAVLSSTSAPTTDPMIPNKKYVDDRDVATLAAAASSTSAIASGFSAGSANHNTSTRKIMVVGFVSGVSNSGQYTYNFKGYIGATSSPSTQVVGGNNRAPTADVTNANGASFSFIVPAGWYWEVDLPTWDTYSGGSLQRLETWEIG